MAENKHAIESGIVEGFYGKPWSANARDRFLEIAAGAGFNSYIYAPKDDPFHRERWREQYPAAESRAMAALIRRCGSLGMDFCWALSPGLSFGYSSRDDFKTLAAKFESMAGLGVKTFALFLDDIPTELQRRADKAKWNSLAAAQSDLVNRLRERLSRALPGSRLWFCPTEYIGVMPTPYLETIGKNIEPEVGIFWTGPLVVSPRITTSDASSIGSLLRRKPLLWDNYPVNDYNPAKLNLGPISARDAGLPELLSGYFVNPMNQAMASVPPTLTIADYLKDSRAYDPAESWKKSLRAPWGKKLSAHAVSALEFFCSFWAPGFFYGEPTSALHFAVAEARKGRPASLKNLLTGIEKLPEKLAAHPDLKDFHSEVKPFLNSLAADAQTGLAALAARKSPSNPELKRALVRKLKKSESAPVKATAGKMIRIFAADTLASLK